MRIHLHQEVDALVHRVFADLWLNYCLYALNAVNFKIICQIDSLLCPIVICCSIFILQFDLVPTPALRQQTAAGGVYFQESINYFVEIP